MLVSAVAQPDQARAAERGVRALFMLVDVTTAALAEIGRLLDAGAPAGGRVGEVLPLEEAVRRTGCSKGSRTSRGKIVLRVAAAG